MRQPNSRCSSACPPIPEQSLTEAQNRIRWDPAYVGLTVTDLRDRLQPTWIWCILGLLAIQPIITMRRN